MIAFVRCRRIGITIAIRRQGGGGGRGCWFGLLLALGGTAQRVARPYLVRRRRARRGLRTRNRRIDAYRRQIGLLRFGAARERRHGHKTGDGGDFAAGILIEFFVKEIADCARTQRARCPNLTHFFAPTSTVVAHAAPPARADVRLLSGEKFAVNTASL